MAMPDTGDRRGTPASISASEPPQTEAIELEPFDSVIFRNDADGEAEVSREGIIDSNPRLARRPCPISRRLGPTARPVSPVAKGGKL